MHELGAIGNEISREVQGRLRELVQFRDVGGFETDVESGEIVLQLRKRPGPEMVEATPGRACTQASATRATVEPRALAILAIASRRSYENSQSLLLRASTPRGRSRVGS